MSVNWNWRYDDFGELLRGAEMKAYLEQKAEDVAKAARQLAPVGTPPEDTHPGLYRDSFEVDSGLEPSRAFGRVTNTAPYAAAVEYGNGRIQAHHVLSRALDIARSL